MFGLTRLQTLEKQNKDLRIRLENRDGKAELAMAAMEDEIKSLRDGIRDKDRTIAMLQQEIGAVNKALEAAAYLQAETLQEQIDAAVAEATTPLLEERTLKSPDLKPSSTRTPATRRNRPAKMDSSKSRIPGKKAVGQEAGKRATPGIGLACRKTWTSLRRRV
jgi:predicted  nucleic acid-binding Zn-ribbon protein